MSEEHTPCDQGGGPGNVILALPIQTFHPVFQEFLDRIDDPKFKPDEEVVANVSRLMHHSSRLSEITPFEMREILIRTLEGRGARSASERSHSSDRCVIFKQEGERIIPLILLEYDRLVDEEGYDPYVDASWSLRELLYDKEVRDFRMFCVIPCLVSETFPGSTSFPACLVVHLSFSLVLELICPYAVPSTGRGLSFSTSVTSASRRPPCTKIHGYTASQNCSHRFATLVRRWMNIKRVF